MKTLIQARRMITNEGEIDYPVVRVEDGVIRSIEPGKPPAADAGGETLTPRFFDIHVHGAMSYDFMDASLREVNEVGRFLSARGVGHYLPTTVTGPVDTTLHALEQLADAIERHASVAGLGEMAQPVGIHLEGPFVSHAKRGVHPVASILQPSVEVFERFQQAARGQVSLMTIAPELPGALELISHAVAAGVRVSLGHSNATRAETLPAVAAGATSATHTFNAMRGMESREPGILGAVLDSDDLYAELICDGVHVDPAMVRLWLKSKGRDRAILVTDGMAATGMPDGVYKLGELEVEVQDGVCRSGSALAGSVLTMDRAVENVMRFTGTDLGLAVRLASHNPAKLLGLEHVGAIAVGARADFNIFDEAGRFAGSVVGGMRSGA